MRPLRNRCLPFFFCLCLLAVVGCAPPSSSSSSSSGGSNGGGGNNNETVDILGKVIVPSGVVPKISRQMYAALTGDALSGATIDLLDSNENLIASTVSDGAGSYAFSDVNPGKNYIINAYLGNINLYSIVPFVDDSDVNIGQTDAASTALYLLAEYYVFDTTNSINSFADIDPGSIKSHLDADPTLINSILTTIESFGDTQAVGGDVIGDTLDQNIMQAQANAADEPAVSIVTNVDTTSVNGVFYVYVNVAFVENLYGAAFDLEYDSTLIQVKDGNSLLAGIQPVYTQGSFFDSTESTILVDFEEGNLGKLLIGISNKHDLVTTGNDGSGNLLRLTFKALNVTGSASISFDSTSILTDPNLDEIITDSWGNASKQITIQ